MPFCHLTFSAVRPPLRSYERKHIRAGTLGAAFRERRWARGLEQRDVAAEIGVALITYRNWEVNRSAPDLRNVPGAIRFLGFDWRSPTSFGERLRRVRTAAGLSISELAVVLRVGRDTLRGLESDRHQPSELFAKRADLWIEHRKGHDGENT